MTASPVAAADWFGLLDPIDPPGWDQGRGWCLRHYAPVVRLGGNEVGASLEVARLAVAKVRAENPGVPFTWALPRVLAGRAACCYLGDEQMMMIWARWIPRVRARSGKHM